MEVKILSPCFISNSVWFFYTFE